MKLGLHVSTSGGIYQAVDRATELGCNTFQIFVSNPRSWKTTTYKASDVQLFKQRCLTNKIDEVISHSIYLINLASPREDLRELSIKSLVTDLAKSTELGLSGLVTHIGSHQGDGLQIGLKRVSEALERVLYESTGPTRLLLENTAGAGNLVGKNFAEFGEIFKCVKSDHIGICLDTAHAFEYGYKLHTKKGLEDLIHEIDQTIGLDKLKVIHLNDSLTKLSSNRDRHEKFGEGFIGKEAMIRIINCPEFKNIPLIMETPQLITGGEGKEFIDEIKSYAK
jgi:deoxyribonuclease-4